MRPSLTRVLIGVAGASFLAACSTGTLGGDQGHETSPADGADGGGGVVDDGVFDANSDLGPGDADVSSSDGAPADAALTCKTGTESFRFTVTSAAQFKRIPLPLDPGVEYRRITLSFDYTPTRWSGTCYNPASSKGSGFPIFESLVALKRGEHWCKGGDLFELTLHGPAPGHGASDRAGADTFYKAKAHTGSGCGTTDIEAKIFSGSHGLTEGVKQKAQLVYDATKGSLVASIGPSTHTGPIDPAAKVIANGSENWNVVLSFDGGFLECYDGTGVADPTAPCCWGPSLGWVFEDLSWEICR